MSRKPKPHLYRGFYVTDSGGIPHQKLCPESEGPDKAEECLMRLRIQRADASQMGNPLSAGAGITALMGPQPKNVREAVDEWLDLKKAKNAPATYASYVYRIKEFCKFRARSNPLTFGERSLTSLDLSDGLQYEAYLKTEKPGKIGKRITKGVGVCSTNQYLRAAKIFLNWCAKINRRYIERTPWDEIALGKEKPHERTMTDDEKRIMLEQCTDGNVSGGALDMRDILTAFFYTPMRPGDVRKLRWEYIKWDTCQIRLPADVVKTRSIHTMAMVDNVKAMLSSSDFFHS